MPLLHGKERTASGQLDTTEKAAGLANTFQDLGWNKTSAGSPYIDTDAALTGAVAAGGCLFTSDGALHVTTSAPTSVIGGIGRVLPRVCVTADAVANTSRRVNDPFLGSVLVNPSGAIHFA